ncbi:hypothetical protein HUO05_06805 [Vibrio alginolyticus]|uniref:hypothetical protein n=1 Tax=Vibrio alginolyticus TaxID=663 RepID=UPI0015935127|nr:hypothetical protein [Vibrio alginolyticus]QKS94935.1 hypothetical protein HUO05_06805 [Vibrio alginolyticus]
MKYQETIGNIKNPNGKFTSVDVPKVIIVLGSAAVGAYVGNSIGGAVGALVGSLVAAFIATVACSGMLKSFQVSHSVDGDVQAGFEFT